MKTAGENRAMTIGKHDFFNRYAQDMCRLLTSLDVPAVQTMVDMFLDARERGNTIFFAGNGGSAATASHFSQDLGEVGRKVNQPGFKTLSLTDNVPQITAIGNDYGYEYIFSIQLKEIFRLGDILVVISASGNSPNVINAVETAKHLGGRAIGLVGFDGGKLSRLCDHVVHVRTPKGEYGPVEDIHMILDHMVTSFLIDHLKARSPSPEAPAGS
jgi:D-sedoheptulose 7-phosphate isomerase